MSTFVAEKVISLLESRNKKIAGAHILILGITFKENCPDIRNSRVIDLFQYLDSRQAHVDVYDPWAGAAAVQHEYNVSLLPQLDDQKQYDAVILAVAHKEFATINFEKLRNNGSIIYDIKSFIDRKLIDGRL